MNPTYYKDIVNSRGYKYHYYSVQPKGNQLTLVFVHGFPNTSRDWRLVVPFFESQGYGIIAPDMLAYGGTDKPTDPKEYQWSLLAKDIVDILDAENVKQAVAIGHDWGSVTVGRLSNFFPERFLAYAWMNVPYNKPSPNFEIEEFMALAKKVMGYEPFGYWFSFSEEGSDKLIEENMESFMSTIFPKDSSTMKDAFIGRAALRAALQNDYRVPLADFLTDDEKKIFIESFGKGRMAAPLCYYKIMVSNGRNSDDATISEERTVPPVSAPLFFGAALRDRVCDANTGKATMAQEALKNHNITIREFDGDHWLLLYPETADAVNRELSAWLENVVAPPLAPLLKARV